MYIIKLFNNNKNVYCKHHVYSVFMILILVGIIRPQTFGQSKSEEEAKFIMDIIPPAPTSAALGKYTETPVDLYSGIPTINIPLFNLTSKGVEMPISLSYHAGGIRVEEYASNVGLGWSLNAGGVITRTVRGGHHDEKMIEWQAPQSEWHGTYGFHHIDEPNGDYPSSYDALPDLFCYNMFSSMGQFVMPSSDNAIEIPYKNMLISTYLGRMRYWDFTATVGTKMLGFNLIDDNGIKYKFSQYEVSKNIGFLYSVFDDVPSSYFLSSVHNSNGQLCYTIDYDSIETISYPHRSNDMYGSNISFMDCQCDANYTPTTNIIEEQIRAHKMVKRIEFDNGYLLFFYNHNREDIINDKALTRIEQYLTDGTFIKAFELSYEYFSAPTKAQAATRADIRLKLVSVQEFSAIGFLPAYNFDYYYNINGTIPSINSKEQDYWGFFNDNGEESLKPHLYLYPDDNQAATITPFPRVVHTGDLLVLEGSDRTCNPNKVNIGSLKSIQFPTGGSVTYNYEANKFMYLGEEQVGPGQRIREIVKTFGDSEDEVIRYTYTKMNSEESSGAVVNIPQFSYKCNTDPDYNKEYVRFDYNKASLGANDGKLIGYSVVKEEQVGINNTTIGTTLYYYSNAETDPDIPPYVERVLYPPNDDPGWHCESSEIEVETQYPFGSWTSKKTKRGLLNQMEVYEVNSTETPVKRITYDYHYFTKYSFPITAEITFKTWGYHGVWYGGYTDKTSHSIISDAIKTASVTEEYNFNGVDFESKNTLFTYNNDYYSLKTEEFVNSDGSISKIIITHPQDVEVPDDYYTTQEVIDELINRNQLNKVLAKESFSDDTQVSGSITNFIDNNGMLQPDKSMIYDVGIGYRVNINYENFDIQNNIIEYKKEDDTPVAILWGYDYKYPIAMIENIDYISVKNIIESKGVTYEDLQQKTTIELKSLFSGIINDSKETSHALYNSMIHTYTYDPLIGMTSETKPNGDVTTYHYDDFNRLITIRDRDENVLQHFEYNYSRDNLEKVLEVNPELIEAVITAHNYTAQVTSNVTWTLQESENWIECSVEGGTGIASFTITVLENAHNPPREGIIIISQVEGSLQTEILIQQDGIR